MMRTGFAGYPPCASTPPANVNVIAAAMPALKRAALVICCLLAALSE
jgi:hypothetical protein